MRSSFRIPSIGIEEEYQLVDHVTGALVPTGRKVLREMRGLVEADIQHELHLEQIEMASPILTTSTAVEQCLHDVRSRLSLAAQQYQSKLVAAGTHPMKMEGSPHVTPVKRYLAMAERYQALAKELIIFGCHVHVDMPDRDMGIAVSNRLRPWLPLLQAMTANSPFWDGQDTGYASFRRELWSQWPLAGVPAAFKNYYEYTECIQMLVDAEAIDDASKIYWDMRLPEHLPTIEVRVFDVMTDAAHVVALTAVLRALVMRCEHDIFRNLPFEDPRQELLQSAMWQAARFGLRETLLCPLRRRKTPPDQLLDHLFDFISEPLEILGDTKRVKSYLHYLKQHGSPSEYQRRLFQQLEGDFTQLVHHLASATAPILHT